jgi:hypothetical protein
MAKNFNFMSRLQKIIFWGVLTIVIAAGLSYYYGWRQIKTEEPAGTGEETAEQIQIPAATANIDAAIDAAIQGLTAESSVVSGEDKDSSLLGSDKQAIDDFGQSYDEKEF